MQLGKRENIFLSFACVILPFQFCLYYFYFIFLFFFAFVVWPFCISFGSY